MISRLFLPQGCVFGHFRLEVRIILAGFQHKEQVAPGVSVHAGPPTEIHYRPGGTGTPTAPAARARDGEFILPSSGRSLLHRAFNGDL